MLTKVWNVPFHFLISVALLIIKLKGNAYVYE